MRLGTQKESARYWALSFYRISRRVANSSPSPSRPRLCLSTEWPLHLVDVAL